MVASCPIRHDPGAMFRSCAVRVDVRSRAWLRAAMTRAAIKHAEEQLRSAMLAGDVERLDDLIDDALVFVTPAGALVRKDEDVDNHRSGALKLTRMDPRELFVELFGEDIGVATVLVDLEGSLGETTFAGTFRYVRTWRRSQGTWRVIAGAVLPLPGA